MHGYFTKSDYWFEQLAPHACQMIRGTSVRDIDQPPLTMIVAAPSWGITKKVIDKMILDLEHFPETWWDTLPRQG
jgi:hypothetical protein